MIISKLHILVGREETDRYIVISSLRLAYYLRSLGEIATGNADVSCQCRDCDPEENASIAHASLVLLILTNKNYVETEYGYVGNQNKIWKSSFKALMTISYRSKCKCRRLRKVK